MIKKIRKYCCGKLMETKGVYDFDKKTQSLLYRCLCCGSFEEVKTEKMKARKLIHKNEFL